MSFKIISIHKEESISFDKVQDKYSISDYNFCVADGTTQGYDSGKFAEIISNNFTKKRIDTIDDFYSLSIKSSKEFNKIPFIESGNKAIDKLRKDKKKKGGSSTLIGCNINENKVSIVCYGDSMLFHIRSEELIEKYPFKNSKELDESSEFINSNIEFDDRLLNKDALLFKKIYLEDYDQIILSTDAISKFFIEKGDFKILNRFSSFNQFKDFMVEKWNSGEIERDDITVLIYTHDGINSIESIIPDEDFKFKELTKPDLNSKINKNLMKIKSNDGSILRSQLEEKGNEGEYLLEKMKILNYY